MSKDKPKPLPSRNQTHRWAKYIVGIPTPRWWWRSLSAGRYATAIKYVANIWQLANDNNVRVLPKPRWFPKRFIWGGKR